VPVGLGTALRSILNTSPPNPANCPCSYPFPRTPYESLKLGLNEENIVATPMFYEIDPPLGLYRFNLFKSRLIL
jgi:hypothetical protein